MATKRVTKKVAAKKAAKKATKVAVKKVAKKRVAKKVTKKRTSDRTAALRSGRKKKAFLVALEAALGIKTAAAKKVRVSRQTVYNWISTDKKFAEAVEEIEEVALDFAESQLHQQIKGGNTAATIFMLKCKGKKRGFIERNEITGAEGESLGSMVFNIPPPDPNESS